MPHFEVTTSTRKILALKQRIRAVAGGTSASKTISILFWLIDYGQTKQAQQKKMTVVSESFPHLQDGAIADFKAIMMDRGYWDEDLWHDTKHTYTFETGNELQFMSFDKYGKAHGPRRDVLYVNECNHLAYDIVDQLITRTRETIWLDWNPSNSFWFYEDMLPNRTDIDFITLTYMDNEALLNEPGQNTIKEIEAHRHNEKWWKVYALGQLGEIEGQIFKDWQIIDEIPHEARLEVRGLDFGYAKDPSVLVDVYKYNGGYIVDERTYQVGMLNRQLADVILNQQDPNVLTIADSAEPKSIDEMSEYGVNITGVIKRGTAGVNFTNSAIQFVQGQKISITKRSTRLIKSYRNFMWQTDKDGKIIPKYDHYQSDGMMAVVYAMTNFAPREEDSQEWSSGDLSALMA